MSAAASASKSVTAALAELRDPQKLRIATLLAAALVLALTYWSSRDEIATLRRQLKKEQERARLLDEVDALKAAEERVNARFPPRNTVNFWTEKLVERVRETGVVLESLEPKPLDKVRFGRLQGAEIRMAVEGPYRDVYRLVSDIESARWPARFTRVSLHRGKRGLVAEMSLAVLTEVQ
jgi:Tfp pilus assembly protein PilO